MHIWIIIRNAKQYFFNFTGTTDFYSSLTKHPLIAPTVVKESNFWFRSLDVGMTFNDYVELYDPVAEDIRRNKDMITIDASPENIFVWNHTNYRYKPPPPNPRFVANEIRALNPATKIIIMLRNPVSWMYSLYRHVRRKDADPQEFHNCMVGNINKFHRCLSGVGGNVRRCAMVQMKRNACALQHSIYYVYIEEWLKVFPRKQVYIVRAEDYYSNRSAVMADVFNFLELPALKGANMKEVEKQRIMNVGAKRATMLTETKHLLTNFTAKYNSKLVDLLDDSKFSWNDLY